MILFLLTYLLFTFYGTEWPIMYWCAIKQLLTYLHTKLRDWWYEFLSQYAPNFCIFLLSGRKVKTAHIILLTAVIWFVIQCLIQCLSISFYNWVVVINVVCGQLHKCAQLCPDRISWLFDDDSTSRVSVVVDWRPDSMLPELQHVSLIA